MRSDIVLQTYGVPDRGRISGRAGSDRSWGLHACSEICRESGAGQGRDGTWDREPTGAEERSGRLCRNCFLSQFPPALLQQQQLAILACHARTSAQGVHLDCRAVQQSLSLAEAKCGEESQMFRKPAQAIIALAAAQVALAQLCPAGLPKVDAPLNRVHGQRPA